MKPIGNLIANAVGRDEVIRAAKAQMVLKRWPEVVGEDMATRSWPDGYTRGTVWVAVSGSAWAQELRMMNPRILKKLQTMAGDPALFTEVRYGQRPLPDQSQPIPDGEPSLKDYSELSIREIAERRLARRRNETT